MTTWDNMFMMMCDVVSTKSKDTSTKVGCVIVGPDNEVRSVGFNGFPRGAVDKIADRKSEARLLRSPIVLASDVTRINDEIKERFERPLKYKWTEHAERNAIYNAARMGTSLNGCKMYIHSTPPLPSCTDCARAIIQSGISEVIISSRIKVPERWKEDCEIANNMLIECGVRVRSVDHEPIIEGD